MRGTALQTLPSSNIARPEEPDAVAYTCHLEPRPCRLMPPAAGAVVVRCTVRWRGRTDDKLQQEESLIFTDWTELNYALVTRMQYITPR